MVGASARILELSHTSKAASLWDCALLGGALSCMTSQLLSAHRTSRAGSSSCIPVGGCISSGAAIQNDCGMLAHIAVGVMWMSARNAPGTSTTHSAYPACTWWCRAMLNLGLSPSEVLWSGPNGYTVGASAPNPQTIYPQQRSVQTLIVVQIVHHSTS